MRYPPSVEDILSEVAKEGTLYPGFWYLCLEPPREQFTKARVYLAARFGTQRGLVSDTGALVVLNSDKGFMKETL